MNSRPQGQLPAAQHAGACCSRDGTTFHCHWSQMHPSACYKWAERVSTPPCSPQVSTTSNYISWHLSLNIQKLKKLDCWCRCCRKSLAGSLGNSHREKYSKSYLMPEWKITLVGSQPGFLVHGHAAGVTRMWAQPLCTLSQCHCESLAVVWLYICLLLWGCGGSLWSPGAQGAVLGSPRPSGPGEGCPGILLGTAAAGWPTCQHLWSWGAVGNGCSDPAVCCWRLPTLESFLMWCVSLYKLSEASQGLENPGVENWIVAVFHYQ